MPKPYRSRSRIVLDILRAVRDEGDAQVTRLLLLSNLSHPRLKEHLDELTGKGWLAEADDAEGTDGRRSWRLTEEGRRMLAELDRIDQAMQDLGLGL
ncbi:MAG: winged helix-turn-helix domain-containing protein [Thermoplasmatota archaeon]